MVNLATLHPGTTRFETTIRSVLEDGALVLEETYFYPTSGGQPADTGILQAGSQELIVKEVQKRGEDIVHLVVPQQHTLKPGDHIRAHIDEKRRSILRRMHTAMHVLCAVIEKAEGTQITGNQIGEERSRLDVNIDEYDPERIAHYVERANQIIDQARDVHRRVTDRSEIESNPSLVKLAAGFPEHIQDIHIVEIEGFDVQPCGGTHVDNTQDIGRIVLLKTENRGKNNRRIYFSLEE